MRPSSPSPNTPAFLHIADVELYNLAGARIPAASLSVSLSSTWMAATVNGSAANCNDGNLNTFCSSADGAPNTTNPTLRITYPCADGVTALSRVVVFNRKDACNCQGRIQYFSLYFISAQGVQDTTSFKFPASAELVYNVTVAPPGEGAGSTVEAKPNTMQAN